MIVLFVGTLFSTESFDFEGGVCVVQKSCNPPPLPLQLN